MCDDKLFAFVCNKKSFLCTDDKWWSTRNTNIEPPSNRKVKVKVIILKFHFLDVKTNFKSSLITHHGSL